MKSRTKPQGVTTADIAAAIGKDETVVRKRARDEGWAPIGRVCPGGIVYDPDSLAQEVKLKVLSYKGEQLIKSGQSDPATPPAAAVATATVTASTSGDLRDWQRKRAEARAALLAEVKRIAGEVGVERAIRAMVKLAQGGKLPEHLQRLVPVANARSGAASTRTLSRGSLYRWMRKSEEGFAALSPKRSRADAETPAWLLPLLALYQRPTQPGLAGCLAILPKHLPAGAVSPSMTSARRWLKKMSVVDLARGRMGPRAHKSIRPFVRRDSSHMWPGDCYTADGHTFDAEVANPAHGRPFRPEVTGVIDVATRRAVGWSAGLAESTWAVLDAQRNAVENCGICALWYVDNGSGYRNAMQADEVVGFAARLGITITHSLPYNSQARGVIERSHQTLWVAAAKALPTYMGAAMDREAKQNVFKLTRAHVKASGSSPLLMPWTDFLAFCQAQIDAYNNRPHRSLPKIRDASSGKLRHMSPNEAWQQAITEGWQPATVAAEDAADLFRPYKICTTNRGELQLFNNRYFHKALADFHGEKVRVGYDIRDAGRVWVRDNTGRLICIAEFEANSRAYFPQSVIDQAAERRAQGRIRRAEARIDEAEAELNPPAMIEHQTANTLDMPLTVPLAAHEEPLPQNVVQLPAAATSNGRPRFADDLEMLYWLAEHRGAMDDYDWDWMVERASVSQTFDREWRRLFGPGASSGGENEFGTAAR